MTTTTKPAGSAVARILDRLDGVLGKVTMYRLVTLVLAVLVAVSFAYSLAGVLDTTVFRPGPMVLSLLVLVIASVASGKVLGLVFRSPAHTESALITALILWFLYWPQSTVRMLALLAAVAVLANLSKYVLALRKRHIFNPAAAGVVLSLLLFGVFGVDVSDRLLTTWWVASEALLPFVAIGALLILRRTRRLGIGVAFVVAGAALIVVGLSAVGTSPGESLRLAFTSYPLVFLAGFMLSEPLTLPPRRWQQILVSVVAAVVFALPLLWSAWITAPLNLWVFGSTQELALVAANAIAFCFGQRRGIRLTLVRRRELPGGVWRFDFEPERPVRFSAGQYLEISLPHSSPDGRGVRRVFSIASAPDDPMVSIAIRLPAESSSYKRSLIALEPGDVVEATGVSGDFLLPGDPARPVVLVAGGIGITPFLSHVSGSGDSRDAVLVYGVPDGEQVAFQDELVQAGLPVVLVSPNEPATLPDGWTHVAAPFVRADDLPAVVPGLDGRLAYVSGPPTMVTTVSSELRKHVSGVRTDHFSGY